MEGLRTCPFFKTLCLFFIICLAQQARSQDRELDSLLALKEKLPSDTNKAIICNKVAWLYFQHDEYQKALEFANTAGQLSLITGFEPGKAESDNISGVIYCSMGDYPKALDFFLKALRTNEKLGREKKIARNTMNIGIVYMYQSNYPISLKYLRQSLKINQENNDEPGIAGCLVNMALVYNHMKDFAKSIEYNFRALDLNRKTGNEPGMANTLLNIGGDLHGQADSAISAGNMSYAFGKFEEALSYYKDALKLQEKLGDRSGLSHNLCSMSVILIKFKKYAEAARNLARGLEIATEIGSMEIRAFHHQTYVQLYKAMGEFKQALFHQEKNYELKDSLYNMENEKQLVQKQMQFEFEKKEATIQAIAKAENEKVVAIASAEKKKQQLISALIGTGLLLLFLFFLFIFNRYRVTQRQKKIIETQKQLVEEKNKEINDSITYARRLQQAILPPPEYIKEHLPHHFILYKPKDIVAGDFYWMEVADLPGQHEDQHISFIAVADSTGHGVPGAMVSVVCSNALNRAVLQFNLHEPGKILDKTRDIVLETFMKSGEKIQDGMDISLLAIDPAGGTIHWSGANNNLWYIHPAQPSVIKEIKADKQPVGQAEIKKPFTTHTLPYQAGMTFYLFTDGYPDQFGGERGKKLMYRPFQNLLAGISHLEMTEQKNALESHLELWKKGHEQVDDICVVAIRM